MQGVLARGARALTASWLLGACSADAAPGQSPASDLAASAGSDAVGAMNVAGASGSAGTAGAAAIGAGMLADTAGAYVHMGPWRGYAFTSASGDGSSITPMMFDQRAAGQPLCAKGVVGAAADYSGTALVGFNMKQDAAGGAPESITPTKAGVWVKVDNPGGSRLRVQIQGSRGATDPSDRFCAAISGQGGFVPWSRFNTKCWDDSGQTYAMQPLVAAMVLVPGGASQSVHFDFCLRTLEPAVSAAADAQTATPDEGGAGGAAASSAAAGASAIDPGRNSGSGTLTDKYGSAMVMRDGQRYIVQNNVWGDSTSQSVRYEGTTFEVTQQTGSNQASGAGAMGPVSYPSVFIGSNYNRSTSGSNLPKQVNTLSSVMTAWSHNAGTVAGTYNAAYDVWFSTGAGGDSGAPSGGYLMVWLYKPVDAQPIGKAIAQGVTIPGVSGTWDVWLGPNTGNANRPCISYVGTQNTTALSFDLNAFLKDATTRPGAIDGSWYLSNVFAGFEIWSGGVGLKTTAFYASVR